VGAEAFLGDWELNTINTANTGMPLDISYTPSGTMDGTGRIPDYRGEAIQRPNLIGNPSYPPRQVQFALKLMY